MKITDIKPLVEPDAYAAVKAWRAARAAFMCHLQEHGC